MKGNTISYYLPKFFDMELRKNANVSENTIISYKYAFVSLLQFVNKKYKKEISRLELKDLNKINLLSPQFADLEI